MTLFDVLVDIRKTFAEMWVGGRGWILITISLGWLLLFGGQLVFPVVLPQIQAEFSITLTTAGMLLTVQWASYALLQFPGGILGDYFGERNILVMSILVGMVGVALVSFSPNFPAVVIGAVLIGSGAGLFGPARFTTLMDIYPERNGTALGISSAISNGGMAVVPLVGGFVAIVFGWRGSFSALLPFFVLTSIGLWLSVPRATSDERGSADDLSVKTLRDIVQTICKRNIIFATSTMFLIMFLYQGFTSFYPTFLTTVKDYSDGTATLIFTLFFAVAILIQPLAGAAADRFGPQPTMIVLSGIAGCCALLFPTVDTLSVILLLTVGISCLLGFMPVSFTYIITFIPSKTQGSTFGFIRTIYLLFAAIGPFVVGFFGDIQRFDISFTILGIAGFVTMLISLSLSKSN